MKKKEGVKVKAQMFQPLVLGFDIPDENGKNRAYVLICDCGSGYVYEKEFKSIACAECRAENKFSVKRDKRMEGPVIADTLGASWNI